MQGQLQLTLTLLKMNIKKGFLELVKTPAPPLGPMSVKRTRAMTVLMISINDSISSNDESTTNARSDSVKKEQTKKLTSHSNNSKVKKLYKDSQEDENSLGLSRDSSMDDSTVISNN